jgi:poly(hydroxyalkanoate) depolymerase family esterase
MDGEQRQTYRRNATVLRSGMWTAGSYSNGTEHRAYKLYVPSGYRGQPLPLVVMLHGCSQDPDDFARGTGMNEFAERVPFLVLYPAQSESASARRCWNWFKPEHQERDRGEPALIAGMTRQVMAHYGVDPSQVYVAGLSAGGAMAMVMAVTYPDLFAAAGVHSGLAYKAANGLYSALAAMRGREHNAARRDGPTLAGAAPLNHTAPLIVFHGDQDQTVAVSNAHRIVGQWAQMNTPALDGDHPADGDPQALVVEGREADGNAYTRLVFRSGGATLAEEWIVHSLGHAWSGGNPDGSHTEARGPLAAEQMLRFFLSHRLGASVLAAKHAATAPVAASYSRRGRLVAAQAGA